MRNFIKIYLLIHVGFIDCREGTVMGNEEKINKLAFFPQTQVSFPAHISYLQL